MHFRLFTALFHSQSQRTFRHWQTCQLPCNHVCHMGCHSPKQTRPVHVVQGADLSSQLSAVVCEVNRHPQWKTVPVLKPGYTIEGHLLTNDVDVRRMCCLQPHTNAASYAA